MIRHSNTGLEHSAKPTTNTLAVRETQHLTAQCLVDRNGAWREATKGSEVPFDGRPVTAHGRACQSVGSAQLSEVSGRRAHKCSKHGTGDSHRNSRLTEEFERMLHQRDDSRADEKRRKVIIRLSIRADTKGYAAECLNPPASYRQGTRISFKPPITTLQVSNACRRARNGLEGMQGADRRSSFSQGLKNRGRQRAAGMEDYLPLPLATLAPGTPTSLIADRTLASRRRETEATEIRSHNRNGRIRDRQQDHVSFEQFVRIGRKRDSSSGSDKPNRPAGFHMPTGRNKQHGDFNL